MGCDIHGWIERRVGGKWTAHQPIAGSSYEYFRAVDGIEDEKETVYGKRLPVDDRDYRFFAAIANVRNHKGVTSVPQHGFPSDASPECRKDYESWGSDAHSPSYLPLEEAARLWWETQKEWAKITLNVVHFAQTAWDIQFPCAKPFGVPVPDGEYRFVFWFDN